MTTLSSPLSQELQQVAPQGGEIVCHCLRISRDEINSAIESGEVQSVKCVVRATTAGSGCTACHCTIRRMLLEAGVSNAETCAHGRAARYANLSR